MTVTSDIKRSIHLSVFNRSRSRTVNYIIRKLPTNVSMSLSRLRTFLTHQTPKHSSASATHHRPSQPHVLSNLISNRAYNTPLSTVVRGAGAHDRSCRKLHHIPQPKRTSCTTCIHCNGRRSITNNNRFSNHLATPLYVTNNVTLRTLRRTLKVHIMTRVTRLNPRHVYSRRLGSVALSPSRIRTVKTGRLPYVDANTTHTVRRTILITGSGLSSIKNIVRYITCNVPTNINSPVFSKLRGHVTQVTCNVPTIGNIRFNTKFNTTTLLNSRGGSPCHVRSRHIIYRGGSTNNVLNKVSANVPVI